MPQTRLPQAVDAMQTADNTADGAWVLLAGSSGFDLGCWAFCRPGLLDYNLYGGAFMPGAQT